MRCRASVFACFIGVSIAARSAGLSPAELSFLEGEEGCTAAERNRAMCSLSLLQTRMTRRNTDPTNRATEDDQDEGAGDIANIAQDTSRDIRKVAKVSQKVSRAIDTMDVAVAKLFALESNVEDEVGEQRLSSSSSDFVIDQMVQDIKEKVDVTADGLKKKIQVSTDAAEAIRKMSEATSNIDVSGSAESMNEGAIFKQLANSRFHSVALQSWTPSSKTGNDKVGEIHRAASASAVEDIVHRADKIADTLKEVAEAAESNDSKHPREVVSASAKTLEVLDETVGKIKVKADKIAAKLKDAAEPEDDRENKATLKVGKRMQHISAGNVHSSIINSRWGSVRHSWSKSLDDFAGTSDEAHQHSNKKVLTKSLGDTVGTSEKGQNQIANKSFGHMARASETARSATRSLEGTTRTSKEAQKHSNMRFATASHRTGTEINSGEAKDEEQPKLLHDVTKVHTKMTVHDEESSASIGRSSVEHGGLHVDLGKQSQHDEQSNDIESQRNLEQRSGVSDAFTAHSHSVISVKMEKLEDDLDDFDDSLCDPGRVVDFSAAELIHSNLGGAGPSTGEESIVYRGVAAIDGAEVNLVVTALSPYTPYNAKKNGLAGPFGQINLQVETKVDLLFRFVYSSGGDDAPMDPFYFSFVDLDNGMAPLSAEKITVKGFESYRLSEDTEVLFKAQGEDAATFSSSWRGGKLDNPSNPMSMNKLERDRTVTAVFGNTSAFEVTFEESGYASVQGRNFLFAGVSDLVCSREQKCALYECPEGFHLRQTAEFLVCEGKTCTANDRDLCCFAAAST